MEKSSTWSQIDNHTIKYMNLHYQIVICKQTNKQIKSLFYILNLYVVIIFVTL